MHRVNGLVEAGFAVSGLLARGKLTIAVDGLTFRPAFFGINEKQIQLAEEIDV